MLLADGANGVFTVGDLAHVFLEHLAQQRHAGIGATKVFLRSVGHGALRHPGHDVLALDVVGDEPTFFVTPKVFVHDGAFVDGELFARVVSGVEELPGVRVIDGNANLHLVDVRTTDAHVEREHERVPNSPVVVLLG